MKKPFSIKESLAQGWKVMKDHFGLIIGATLIYMVFTSVGNIFGHHPNGNPGWTIPVLLILVVVSIIVHIGYVKLFLKLEAGEHVSLAELFANYSLFWRYLGGNILVGLITAVGFILLIIPGIYFALKYCFTTLLIIDQGLGPVEAMKKSADLTKGVKWQLLLFWLAVIAINVVGAIAVVVGLLVTMPVSFFAYIFVYKKLLADTGSEPAVEVPIDPQNPPADNTVITA